MLMSTWYREHRVIRVGSSELWNLDNDKERMFSWNAVIDYIDEIEGLEGARKLKCSKCGEYDLLNWYPQKVDTLLTKKLCFTCDHWDTFYHGLYPKDGRHVIIKGSGYYMGTNTSSPRQWRGFGGANFVIRMLDTGELVHTADLWHNGEIPAIWEPKDTAEFVLEGV